MVHRARLAAAVGAIGVGAFAAAPDFAGAADVPAIDAGTYDRAALFQAANLENLVLNAHFAAHWRPGAKERFTYLKELGDGRATFVEVIAATGKRAPAFDQVLIAA